LEGAQACRGILRDKLVRLLFDHLHHVGISA